MNTRILTTEMLVEAAAKEGFAMSTKAANVILSYMEGHDYELGLDGDGKVIRNNLGYKDGGAHWEPYSVWDAIVFAAEMCAEIQEEHEDEEEPDKEYIDQLLDDELILAPLYEAAIKGVSDGSV